MPVVRIWLPLRPAESHISPQFNDPAMLFETDPPSIATMRRTRDMEHSSGEHHCHVSGLQFTIPPDGMLSRNDLLNSANCIKIKESRLHEDRARITTA